MHRQVVLLGLLTILLGAGSIVAIVRAQEATPSRDPSVSGMDASRSTPDASQLAQIGGGQSVLINRGSGGSADQSAPRQLDGGVVRPILGAPVGNDPASIPESSRRSNDPSPSAAPVVEAERPSGPLANPYATPPRATRPAFRSADARFSDRGSVDAAASGGAGIQLTGQSPSLRVETTGPRAIKIGDPASYVITMANEGEQLAKGVYARVKIPNSVDLVSHEAAVGEIAVEQTGPRQELLWRVSELAGRSDQKLTMTIRPRSSAPFDVAVAWGFDPMRSAASIVVQEPQLDLQLSGASEMRYGEESLYIISVSNPGTGPAERVSVNLTLGGRVETMELGTLAAGQKKDLEFPLLADQAGVIQILAAASGEGGLRAEATSQVVVRRAALQVQLAAPRLKYAGSQAEFRVVVRNTGDADAADVAASLLLPRGAEYLTGLQAEKSVDGQLVWPVGNLPVGGQREYTVICRLHRAGENRVEALVTDATKLTASQTATTLVKALADLKLLVNDPKGPIAVGESVAYEVEIINRGTKAAEQVKVLGQFSVGIDPVQIDGGRGQMSDDGQVMFDPIARIEPGKTVKLVIMAKASLDGNHRFRAQVTCQDPETNLVAEDTTRFFRDTAVRSSAEAPAAIPAKVPGAAQPTPARKIDVRR